MAAGRRIGRLPRLLAVVGLVVVGLVMAGAAVAAAPARAAQDCGTVVSPADPAVPDDPEVAAAVERLTEAGALPWVRVWTSVPDGDLDAAVEQAVQDCPDIAGTGRRGLAGGAVVLAVSITDRRSGIYYGPDVAGSLDDWWQPMLESEVNPLLRSADVPAAVAAGLSAVAEQLSSAAGGSDGSSNGSNGSDGSDGSDGSFDGVGDGSTPDGSTFPDSPIDCSELPDGFEAPGLSCVEPSSPVSATAALGVGGGVVTLAVGGFGLSRGLRRSRARSAARAAATTARERETTLAAAVEDLQTARARLTDGLAATDAAEVASQVAVAERAAEVARQSLAAEAGRHPEGGLGRLSRASADAATHGWTAAAGRLFDALVAVREVGRQVAADAARVDGFDAAAAALADALPPARAAVGARTEVGFTVADQTAALDAAAAALDRAWAARSDGRHVTAARTVAQAHDAVRQAVAEADRLPARRDAVLAAAGVVAARLDAARIAAGSAVDTLARLQADCDPSCWDDLAPGAAQARSRVERATAAVEQAQVAGSMRQQRWAEAEAAVEAARADLDAVLALDAATTGRLAEVDRVRAALPARLDRALAAARDAERFVRRHRRDVPDQVVDRIDAATAGLAAAAAGLQADRPAWLRLGAEVAGAEQAVVAGYDEARTARRVAERNRRTGFSATAGAGSAFSGSGSSSAGSSGFSGSDSSGGGSTSW